MKVRETRVNGRCGLTETRVVELPKDAPIPAGAEVVPDDLPVYDWTEVTD